MLAFGKLSDSSSKVRSIGTMDLGVFASFKYLAERGTPSRPNQLVKHDCILRSVGPSTKKDRWRLTGSSGTVVVPVDGHIRVDELLGAVAAAVADGGLVLLPVHLPATSANDDALVRCYRSTSCAGRARSSSIRRSDTRRFA